MTTITIEYTVSDAKIEEITSYLDHVAMRDVNWNGADFIIERGDFTEIENGNDYKAISLLSVIHNLIDDRIELNDLKK